MYAIQSKHDHEDAWYERGKVLFSLKRLRGALEMLETTLSLNRKNFHAWNVKGNILLELGQYREAVEAYKLSIELSDYQFWLARKNLGKAYESQNNYSSAFQTWDNGINDLNESSKSYNEGCGVLHYMKAQLYYKQGLRRENIGAWVQSKKSYDAALSFLEDEPDLREYYLEILQKALTVQVGLREKDQEDELRQRASNLLDRLRQDGSHSEKKRLSLKFSDIEQLTVNTSVQSNQLVRAIEIAEKSKNACMTWMLSGWDSFTHPCDWQKMLSFADSVATVIYWHLSPAAITTFVVKPNHSEPILIETVSKDLFEPSQRLLRFEEWGRKWDSLYTTYRSDSRDIQVTRRKNWREQLPQLLQELDEILNISKILECVGAAEQLILIPHRDLHRFPLHALFPQNISISYLPSVQSGINIGSHDFTLSGKMLSVENPDSHDLGELIYADIESAAITQIMGQLSPESIANQSAKKKHVAKALKEDYNFLHFTGHGTYNSTRPEQSALALSGKDRLTLKEILDISFNNYRLVTLSACETAITGKRAVTEEYVGLVSAFLYQRISYIVSTLWTVSEESSILYMVYFYRQLKKGRHPKEALSIAATWLRSLTYIKLERLYSLILQNIPRDEIVIRPFVRQQCYQICNMTAEEKQENPFSNPYHWAAFVITGR